MADSTHSLLIDAGLRLYPHTGYHRLSVRLLAGEAGLSPGMFHHLFDSKDDFVEQMLQRKYTLTHDGFLARVDGGAALPEQLWQTITLAAAALRENIDWVQRLVADSGEGVPVIKRFVASRVDDYQQRVLELLTECEARDLLVPADPLQRLAYLMSSVLGPILIGNRLRQDGMLPAALAARFPDAVLSDEAIAQRLRWSLASLMRAGTPDTRDPADREADASAIPPSWPTLSPRK